MSIRNKKGHDPDYIHDYNYKSLDDYLDDLSIFLGTFNRRPETEIWYSEKTLTTIERRNYEHAIKILRQSFKNI